MGHPTQVRKMLEFEKITRLKNLSTRFKEDLDIMFDAFFHICNNNQENKKQIERFLEARNAALKILIELISLEKKEKNQQNDYYQLT